MFWGPGVEKNLSLFLVYTFYYVLPKCYMHYLNSSTLTIFDIITSPQLKKKHFIFPNEMKKCKISLIYTSLISLTFSILHKIQAFNRKTLALNISIISHSKSCGIKGLLALVESLQSEF